VVKLLTTDGKFLRDFGQGTTTDPAAAHEYTTDEAWALAALYDYEIVDPVPIGIEHLLDGPPPMHPGLDMVWVKHGGRWMAADRQALFLGTRAALRAHKKSVA
jgi:hypothetical protein